MGSQAWNRRFQGHNLFISYLLLFSTCSFSVCFDPRGQREELYLNFKTKMFNSLLTCICLWVSFSELGLGGEKKKKRSISFWIDPKKPVFSVQSANWIINYSACFTSARGSQQSAGSGEGVGGQQGNWGEKMTRRGVKPLRAEPGGLAQPLQRDYF